LLDAIEKSRTITLDRFIFSLGIRHIGEMNAKVLAKQYSSFDNFHTNMLLLARGEPRIREDLLSLNGVGEKVITALEIFFRQQYSSVVVEQLGKIINIVPYSHTTILSPLTDKKILFTGGLQTMSRSEAKAASESVGAKVLTSISEHADFVVVGKDPGSKLKKAKEIGLKIISEEEWKKLLS